MIFPFLFYFFLFYYFRLYTDSNVQLIPICSVTNSTKNDVYYHEPITGLIVYVTLTTGLALRSVCNGSFYLRPLVKIDPYSAANFPYFLYTGTFVSFVSSLPNDFDFDFDLLLQIKILGLRAWRKKNVKTCLRTYFLIGLVYRVLSACKTKQNYQT